jgi:N-acetylglucosaminyldiphosphoundecaprenol N-acetyl-beta-D-mannosaminyltransferase
MKIQKERIIFFNVPIDIISYSSAMDFLLEAASLGKFHKVFTPNVHHIYLVNKSIPFKEAYRDCSLSLIDGIPIIWMLKLLYGIHAEKISGSDMFISLFQKAYDKGLKIFLLGGIPGVAERAVENIRKNSSTSKNVISLSPPFGFELDPIADSKVIKVINEFNPHILFVALGAPKGELWIHHHSAQLKINIALSIGGGLDFAAGHQKRAPKWMQRIGLEWFFRLCNDPRRLFFRYFISNCFFIKIVVEKVIDNLFIKKLI